MNDRSWYTGKREHVRPGKPVTLPISLVEKHTDPGGYLADEGLADAVNVALQLGQPLLLTGEPGTGKTQAAYSVAWQLGFDPPLKFETKSGSVSRDLFYTYDALGRFFLAQVAKAGDDEVKAHPLEFIHYNALGTAILRARNEAEVQHLLPAGFAHGGKRRSVVLIDEIDKAPRDFPNDVLNEVEGMYFKVPELGNAEVRADPDMRPVLIMTSNSEKNLPDAFLRRCVFYHIGFPDDERLREIVFSRMGEAVMKEKDGAFLGDALQIFSRLRDTSAGLNKAPSTGEFLAWLRVMTADGKAETASLRSPEMVKPTLSTLVKTVEDRQRAETLLTEWLETKPA
jgi:MoxR-like ATPase